jgi:hypothetical protein
MMISWWSKHVGVVLSIWMCDISINVLLYISALVGPLHIVNWNARLNSEILESRVYPKHRNKRIVLRDAKTGRPKLDLLLTIFLQTLHVCQDFSESKLTAVAVEVQGYFKGLLGIRGRSVTRPWCTAQDRKRKAKVHIRVFPECYPNPVVFAPNGFFWLREHREILCLTFVTQKFLLIFL